MCGLTLRSCWLPSIINNILAIIIRIIVFTIAIANAIVKTIVIIIIIIIMIDIKGRVAGQHPEGTLIGLTTLSSGHLDAMAPYLIFVLFCTPPHFLGVIIVRKKCAWQF